MGLINATGNIVILRNRRIRYETCLYSCALQNQEHKLQSQIRWRIGLIVGVKLKNRNTKLVLSPVLFLSRVSTLTSDIDIAVLSVRLSVCPLHAGIL